MKQYVITDPCYILPSEEWNRCCALADEDKDHWESTFNNAVEAVLTKFSGGNCWVESTGFGDWDNRIDGPNVQGIGNFCADSGLVCICELSSPVSGILGTGINTGKAAVFEAEGPITVDFDFSHECWTVVWIKDTKDNTWNTLIPSEDEEDE